MALTDGPNLGLLVNGAQGEAHYPELMKQFRGLDSLVQCKVLSATTTAQPGSPTDGDTYIVPVGATGASWAGKDGKVARYSSVAAAWEYYTPHRGWRATSQANDTEYYYSGSAWVPQYAARIDAVGSNVAASDLTIDAALSTGNATPAARIFRVGVQGASGATQQTATEAWRLQELANATTREVAAMNVTGPVMGGLPANTPTDVMSAGDGGRFATRIIVVRNGASSAGAQVQGWFSRGTLTAPTAVLSGDGLLVFGGNGYHGAGYSQQATVRITATENWSAGARGCSVSILGTQDGSTAQSSIVIFRRASGATAAEMVSGSSTLRIIGGSTLTGWRDSANSAYLDQWTDTGVRRIIGPVALGTVGADPDGSALLDLVSTTRGLGLPAMTGTQRDAISSPREGLVLFNTSTSKAQVRAGGAWVDLH